MTDPDTTAMPKTTRGEQIRRRRNQLGLAQIDLAAVAGLSRGSVYNAEAGKLLEPATAQALERALGWEPDGMARADLGERAPELIKGAPMKAIIHAVMHWQNRSGWDEVLAAFHCVINVIGIGDTLPADAMEVFEQEIITEMSIADAGSVREEMSRIASRLSGGLGYAEPAESSTVKHKSPRPSVGGVTLGYSYTPASHAAVKQLVVSAEIVLAERIKDLTGGPDVYDGNLMELLLALVALPEDVRGQTAPELLEIAEAVRRG